MPFGQAPPSFEEFFRRFFEQQSYSPTQRAMPEFQSMGSGFIVDPEGLVVTNNHVIENADEITVTLDDGTQLPAELIGRDPKTDLALLKVDSESELAYASFGDSEDTRAGDWVIAIGNPFGLGGTATTGIVSARGRDIQAGPFDDFLQIDAPINRGNSGGPLFDASGQVIGVNTAIYSPNGGNVGIGFAIPAAQAAPIITQLREDGYVERGWLGVQIQQIDDELAAGLGLEESNGALVSEVVTDSPAERAGLEPGDVIVAFEQTEIETIKDLTRAVAEVRPDSDIELEVWRDGKSKKLDVSLGESPDDRALQAEQASEGNAEDPANLGLSLAPLTPESRQRFGIADHIEGALIAGVAPEGPAARKGLRPGDVILRVGREETGSPAEVKKEIDRLTDQERESAVLQVARGEARSFVAIPFA
jgi:serine protease Do